MKELVIFGCGGFGREVADVVDAINAVNPIWQIVGFADDGPSPQDLERLHRTGRRHLSDEDLAGLGPSVNYVIAVGDGQVRRRLSARLDGMGWSAAVLVHPSATIGAEVTLGPGTVICAGVRITTNIVLGQHVHVNLNSTIGHDSHMHDFVTINPLVAISGGVTLAAGAMMGTHSAILQNLTVGAESVVGAGSLVAKPVPDGVVIKGVPAR